MRSRVLGSVMAVACLGLFASDALAAPKDKPAPSTPAPAPAAPVAKSPTSPEPGATSNDPVLKEARQRYARGVELYNEGDFKLALIEFERSYELAPNWKILFNIGEVHFQLNNYAKALKALEKYLAQGSQEIPAKRRADVEKDIESLRARTSFLTIKTNVEGAEVHLDDNVLGSTPLDPELLVDAGNHGIVVSKAGYRSERKNVTLAGKDRQTISITLSEESKAVVYAQPEAAPSRNLAPIIGWTTTGVLTAAAVVTGILAVNADSDYDDTRASRDVTRREIDDAESKRDNLLLATDVLAGAAIVAGVVSLYFTLKGPSSPSKEGPTTTTTLRPGVRAGAFLLGGTF